MSARVPASPPIPAPGSPSCVAPWARALVESATPKVLDTGQADTQLELRECGPLALLSLRVVPDDPAALRGPGLTAAAEGAYRELARVLERLGRSPLRIWNVVPAITEVQEAGLTGYEHFNAGRHRAVGESWSAPGQSQGLVAASAVDLRIGQLEVHVLAGDTPGQGVQNPRQIPPAEYSRRYGPRPPVFARALLVPESLCLASDLEPVLVSGTASIRGEDTWHRDDLEAQLREVETNLEVLGEEVAAAARARGRTSEGCPFARFRTLRIYAVRREDEPRLLAWARQHFPAAREVELRAADLCRADLLVEVEATTTLEP